MARTTRRGKRAPVTGTRQNVVFCDFKRKSAQRNDAAAGIDQVLSRIRSTVAEINAAAADAVSANIASAQTEKDVTQLMLCALDSMDNLGFQSNLFAAIARGEAPADAERAAANVLKFVSAGAAVNQQLRALLAERSSRSSWEVRMLQEIAARAAELETLACASMEPVRGAGPAH